MKLLRVISAIVVLLLVTSVNSYGGTAASIISPVNKSTLSGSTVAFNWSGGVGISEYVLWIGTTANSHNLGNIVLTGTATSTTVSSMPTNGENIYVTLNCLSGTTWLKNSYVYIASGKGTAAAITLPANKSTFSGASATFNWSGGNGISEYVLWIGTTTGSHNLGNVVLPGTATSTTVTNMPTNGENVYVTLNSLNGVTWLKNSYSYLANGTGTAAAITSPANGTKLSDTSATFTWSGGNGISEYLLWIGSSAGGHNIDNIVLPSTATSVNVTNLPNDGSTVYVTLNSLNGATWLKSDASYGALGTPLTLGVDHMDYGLISSPYNLGLNVYGGAPPYTVSVGGGALPPGLGLLGVSGLNETIAGTPTTAGTYNFTLKVVDSHSNKFITPAMTIGVSAAPTGTHNAWIKGRYICENEYYNDSDDSRMASLASISADGAGKITGVFDMNGRTVGYAKGSLSGTYSLSSNNHGTFTVTATGGTNPKTTKFAILANHLSAAPANVVKMVEIDDVGSTASGQHGGGTCYLASSSAFANSTLSGHSFVFQDHGENQAGVPKAIAGRIVFGKFSGSSGTLSGVADGGSGKGMSWNMALTSGTYSAVDGSTGRFTFSVTDATSDTTDHIGYVIDANNALMMRGVEGTSPSSGAETGRLYRQQQASYSAANLKGSFVFYDLMWEVDSTNVVQRTMSQIIQGQSNGTGSGTYNVFYHDEADSTGGHFDVGPSETGTFAPAASGRYQLSEGNGVTGVMYLYDNNSAVWIAGNMNNNSSLYNVDFGNIEPQTLTTFTDANVTGTYIGGNFPRLDADGTYSEEQVSVDASGNVKGFDDGGQINEMGYGEPMAMTYNWLSTTYGVLSISQGGQQILTCIAISSQRLVCIDNNASSPNISVSQQ